MRQHAKKGAPRTAKELMQSTDKVVELKAKSKKQLKGQDDNSEEEEENPELEEGG
jgi:hypothetical protein